MKPRKSLPAGQPGTDREAESLVEHMIGSQRLLKPTPRKARSTAGTTGELEEAMRQLDAVNEALRKLDDLDEEADPS